MVLERIRQLYPSLTKSQRRLADFVAGSYQEAAFMTASRLARRVSVNEATVIRFAQRLGYPGYPELLEDVQSVVREELAARREPADGPGTGEPVYTRFLHHGMENLRRAISHVPPALAVEALKALQQARRIVVLGQGVSAPLAQLLSISLRAVGLSAESPQAELLSLATALDEVGEDCAVVAISAGPDSPELANALSYAAQRGARTLALTTSPVSACAQAAELAISCPPASDSGCPQWAPLPR